MAKNTALDELGVAWAAGIIEGEGCIYAAVRRQAASQGQYLAHRVRVVMTDEDILERLRDVFGIGRVVPYSNVQGLGTKQLYRWEANKRADAVTVCDAIYPWMGQRRRAAIDHLRCLLIENPEVSRAERHRRSVVSRLANTRKRTAALSGVEA